MTTFAYQLYSSRNFPPLADTFAMLEAEGYGHVEGYGALFADLDAEGVAALRHDLDAAGLSMPSAHFGLDMLETAPERVLAIVETLGIEMVFCPFLDAAARPADAAGWRDFGRRLAAAGKPLTEAGIAFGWHNHDFEFRPVEGGAVPLDLILEAAPGLAWEADIAWIARAGADPFAWIARHGRRIAAVHVKDIAAQDDGGADACEDGWADVGHGTLDWPALMTALAKTPARLFIMEHDNPADDRRFARRSMATAGTF